MTTYKNIHILPTHTSEGEGASLFNLSQQIRFTEEVVFLAFDFHLGTTIFWKQNLISNFNGKWDMLPFLLWEKLNPVITHMLI